MKLIALSILILAGVASVGSAQASKPATRPVRPATRPTAIAPADDVLRNLIKPSQPNPAIISPGGESQGADVTTGKGAVAPGAKAMNVVREGTYLIDRIGRMTRTSDGQMEFAFEADGKNMADPPVMILPNLKLMAMEAAVAASNRDLKFRITGMVTEYKGRNYVLLDKAVVVPEATQQF